MLATKKAEPHHHGILLVDKPQGWTSHDVVAKVRGMARQRQVGHTGTLDPMATGLLVLCLGNATRLVEYMIRHDKTYAGEIALGVSTTTDDTEGDVLLERPVPELTEELLRSLESRFTGALDQRPPAFSAVKVAGQRAYAVARRGGDPELEPRTVQIHRLSLRPTRPTGLEATVHCGAGTYIRSLARDIGEAIGSAGHLTRLRRTTAGPFSVADAWSLESLQRLADDGRLAVAIEPVDEGISGLDAAILGQEHATHFSHGMPIASEAIRESATTRIYNREGRFVGMGRISSDGTLRPLKVLTA